MSNTTKISNKSEFTQLLFKEYFEFQIKEEYNVSQRYIKKIKYSQNTYKDSDFYNNVLDFVNSVKTARPIVVLFFDKSIPVEVSDNVFFVDVSDLNNYSTVSRLRNCLLIVCDESCYNNQILWSRNKRSAVSDMNPEVTFVIN